MFFEGFMDELLKVAGVDKEAGKLYGGAAGIKKARQIALDLIKKGKKPDAAIRQANFMVQGKPRDIDLKDLGL